MPLSPIHYLRWARSRELDPQADISLILSGMSAPPSELFGAIESEDFLRFDHRDLPALGRRMAVELGCEAEELWLQPGTHSAIFSLVAARLAERPGPVLVEEPAYEPLRRIPAFLGAELLRLPRPRARHFQLDWDALDAARAKQPSLLLLSLPHNPSGATLDENDRRRLIAWADESNCAILSDEVYLEFLEDSAAASLRAASPRVMKVGSFTKVMGLGGLRLSFCIGPPSWIRRAAEFSDYAPLAVSGPSQAAGALAWDRRAQLYGRAREAAAAGRELVAAWLERHEGEIDALLPAAGIICFPRLASQLHQHLIARATATGGESHGFGLDAAPGGSHEWIRQLACEERVHLTPGAFFEDPMAFRLGFGIPPEALHEGLTRMDHFLARAKESA